MKALGGVTCLLLAGWVSTAQAQQPVTVDIRAAVAMPGDLAGADLTTGLGFGATLAFRLQPHLHLYGGWDWMQFGADQGFAGADRDFIETGYTFGLRFEHPLGDMSRLLYRVEAGGIYKHVEVEDQDGDLLVDSGHSLGWEAGLGLVWPTGNTWRFGPTLRYRSFQPEFEMGNVTTRSTLSYIGLELGISRKF